jgi:Short C-terminal domain
MPGLLRGVARTAAIAGTATAVSNRVSRRQARRWGQQDAYAQEPEPTYAAPPPPPAAAPAAPDPIAQLKELAALKEQGILTDEEFAAQKAKILGA